MVNMYIYKTGQFVSSRYSTRLAAGHNFIYFMPVCALSGQQDSRGVAGVKEEGQVGGGLE